MLCIVVLLLVDVINLGSYHNYRQYSHYVYYYYVVTYMACYIAVCDSVGQHDCTMGSQMCTGSLYYWLPYYDPLSHDYEKLISLVCA